MVWVRCIVVPIFVFLWWLVVILLVIWLVDLVSYFVVRHSFFVWIFILKLWSLTLVDLDWFFFYSSWCYFLLKFSVLFLVPNRHNFNMFLTFLKHNVDINRLDIIYQRSVLRCTTFINCPPWISIKNY
jgi:hypothetical protein